MSREKKLYPLTTAQKMHYYTLKYCPKKQVLNIGTGLYIEQDIDFNLLRQAIYKAYERCDSMRLRFEKGEDGEVYQYVTDKERREIEYVNFTGWLYDDAEEELIKWTSKPFKRFKSPMNRVVMVTMPDGYNGIYINADHMTMDSYSIITFFKDIIEIYCSMAYDYPFPKPMESYEKALEKDLAYMQGNKAMLRDKEYWKSYIKESEPIFTDLKGRDILEKARQKTGKPNLRAVHITSDNVEANHVKFHLETEPTSRLLKFCEEQGLPMVCLLMMGLRTYLCKVNNKQTDISLKTTVARRGTLLEKRSGGTRIHFFPCRTVVNLDENFVDGMKKIQESQNQIFRHANFDPISIIGMYNNEYDNNGGSYESMSMTYQPLTMKSNMPEIPDISYKSRWYTNGVAASPLYLTVMHNPVDNGLDFYFEYQTGRTDADELEKFYYYLCRILFRGIERPDQPIGEIIDLV